MTSDIDTEPQRSKEYLKLLNEYTASIRNVFRKGEALGIPDEEIADMLRAQGIPTDGDTTE